MIDAYINDPDVIEAMANAEDFGRPGKNKPSMFGWTATLSALKDIQDQMIASRGGTHFVPRPEIPALKEKWRRKDSKLLKTVERICGSE